MIVLLLSVAAFLTEVVSSADSTAEWCYHKTTCDFNNWPKMSSQYCNGTKQSPIDIVTKDVQANPKLTAFNFTGFDDNSTFLSIGNLGDSVVVYLDSDKMKVEGGGLPGTYTTAQFHLHWGNGSSANGSEHTVDGKRYPAELHIVNIHSKYNGSAKAALAANDPTGLAVLGFFIEGTSGKSKSWDILTSFLSNITNSGDTTVDIMNTITMDSLLEGVDRTNYYRYEGSLTTPTCNEIVIWTVFKDTIKVNHDLIRLFSTSIYFKDTKTKVLSANNFRGVQDLNGRTVTSQVSSTAPSSVNASTFCIVILLLLSSFC